MQILIEPIQLWLIVPKIIEAIMFVVVAFNFVGDGLRDALDPKMRE